MTRPYIANQRLAVALGVALFAASWFCLHDAWDGRGQRPPMIVRVLTPA